MKISLQYSGNYSKLLSSEIHHKIQTIHHLMATRSGTGADYLGWVDWPHSIHLELLREIQETADKICEQSNVLIVIGIGGSYIGSKAMLEALSTNFESSHPVEIIFAGHLVNGSYLKRLMHHLDSKEVTVNVVSKSGTTTEPAIAFHFLRNYMENRYGEEASSRIIVTTDENEGTLRSLAIEKGYKRFVIPHNIGGRYSVLTAVGLLPLAVAGYDIHQLINGAKSAAEEYSKLDLEKNPAIQYAVIRKHLCDSGYPVEILSTFEGQLKYVQEWWKQLFAESEGKAGKGIFPTSVLYSTDLHSLGQYIQDGQRIVFETCLLIEKVQEDLTFVKTKQNMDQLNYLNELSLHEFNHICYKAASLAHLQGGVPQIAITIEQIDEEHLGHLFYFFMMACAYSAYLLDINPFDQPGVEEYKMNIFKFLKKPAYSYHRQLQIK